MARDFYSGPQIGKSVEEFLRLIFPEVNGTSSWLEKVSVPARLEPKKNLALDGEREIQLGKQGSNPSSCSEQQVPRAVFSFVREHANAIGFRSPTHDRFVELQRCSAATAEREVGLDAGLRKKNSGSRLANCQHLLRRFQPRELPSYFRGREDFVTEVMNFCTPFCTAKNDPVRWTNH
jgi:hypothetical protein